MSRIRIGPVNNEVATANTGMLAQPAKLRGEALVAAIGGRQPDTVARLLMRSAKVDDAVLAALLAGGPTRSIWREVRYITVQYSTVQYSTVQYSTVQYST